MRRPRRAAPVSLPPFPAAPCLKGQGSRALHSVPASCLQRACLLSRRPPLAPARRAGWAAAGECDNNPIFMKARHGGG